MSMTSRERVSILAMSTVSLFVLASLVFTFILAVRGIEIGAVWSKMFDLIGVLVGGIVGYLAGQQVERSRDPEPLLLPEFVEDRPEDAGPLVADAPDPDDRDEDYEW